MLAAILKQKDGNRRGEEVTAARGAVLQPACGRRKYGNNKDRRKEKAPTGQISDLVRGREGGNKRDETRRVKCRDNNWRRSKDEVQMAATIQYR